MFHRASPSKKSSISNARHHETIGLSESKKLPYSPRSKKRQCFRRINAGFLRLRQFFATAPLWKVILCMMVVSPVLTLAWKRLQSFLHPQQVFSKYHFNQPRMVQVVDDSSSNVQTIQSLLLPKSSKKFNKHNEVEVSSRARQAKKDLSASSNYEHRRRDPLHEGDCEPMRWWQETSFPSCNIMHEKRFEQEVAFLTNGGYNSIFRTVDMDGTTYILKILQYETSHSDRNFDRVRRDSLLMERGTGSKYIMDIYSFCGFAQIVEFGKHGNLEDILWKSYDSVTQEDKLQMATQVSQALADIHDLDGDGISSMSHGDFASKQYILIDGILKLNDFNRGRFIRWNSKRKEPCPYTIGVNDGKFRAPEEYQYVPETAAIDIWALGSIFVELVTGYGVWHGYETDEAQKRIAKGKLPSYHKRIGNSTDPINEILVKAIDMCWIYEPKDRPKAGVVADYLKGEAKLLGINWEQSLFAAQGDAASGS